MARQERISFDIKKYERGYYRTGTYYTSQSARFDSEDYRWMVREEVDRAENKIFDTKLKGIKNRMASVAIALAFTSLFAPLPGADIVFMSSDLVPSPTTIGVQAAIFDYQTQGRREKLVEINDGKTKKKINPNHLPDHNNLPIILKTRKNGFPKSGGINGQYPG